MPLNTNALTTVEAVISAIKMYPFLPTGLDFDDPDVQEQIIRLINSWSSYVEAKTNAKYGVKQYVEYKKGTNQPTLVVNNYPIKELTSIQELTYNGEVVGTLDVDVIAQMMSDEDYAHGIIYIEPGLAGRYTSVGIVPETYTSLRTYKVVYTAGFVLPKDATEETPSDVPEALVNLVIELVKAQFIEETDSIRADNLITLTEGNVQRMWDKTSPFKLTDAQKEILSLFRRKGI